MEKTPEMKCSTVARVGFCALLMFLVTSGRPLAVTQAQSPEDSLRALFEARHQAWLEYCRQPEVLLRSSGKAFVNNEPFQDIIRLGIDAIPLLMERIQDAPIEGRLLHYALTAITKTKFHVRQDTVAGTILWTVEEFPDIPPATNHPDTNLLWLRWWQQGIAGTPQEFQRFYDDWKTLEQSERRAASLSRMVDLGVAALPLMMTRVAAGDSALIPAISQVTDEAVAPDVSIEECLAWWETEKQRWTLRPPARVDPTDQKSTEETQIPKETP